ncbi:MAG: ATP-binding domain-containing protein, partial [Gammaproteobacteria bacterium]|nr:ATP-binding domain-containing protein [Gammaproteobacteria bacterium]
KNALAYLRLISSPLDNAAFDRVVNIPPRGIGEKTLQSIRAVALKENISFWYAMEIVIESKLLPARASNALVNFQSIIETLSEFAKDTTLEDLLIETLDKSGLIEYHKKEKGEKGRSRIENLQELVSAIKQFEQEEDDDQFHDEEFDDLDELSVFLAYTALESGDSQAEAGEDCVQLMTMHSAKGLEFPMVFIVGMEEGLFPSERSIYEADRLAEERRLCYVGMTRAEKQLYLTATEHRRLYGRETYPVISRFIREIPQEVMIDIRPRAMVSRPVTSTPMHNRLLEAANETGFQIGQLVQHAKFGEGVVLNYEGEGHHARVQVSFGEGNKWLVLAYANLK